MASVYKTLSKSEKVAKPEAPANGVRKNKQRVLMLTSRGVTHRYGHLYDAVAVGASMR